MKNISLQETKLHYEHLVTIFEKRFFTSKDNELFSNKFRFSPYEQNLSERFDSKQNNTKSRLEHRTDLLHDIYVLKKLIHKEEIAHGIYELKLEKEEAQLNLTFLEKIVASTDRRFTKEEFLPFVESQVKNASGFLPEQTVEIELYEREQIRILIHQMRNNINELSVKILKKEEEVQVLFPSTLNEITLKYLGFK